MAAGQHPRRALRERAMEAAENSDGVLSRRALRDLGYTARDVAREVSAGRWSIHGRQTIALHTGALDLRARARRALWEVGERIAVVDGVTALQLAGLTGYSDDLVHVSVIHRHDISPVQGVAIHKVRHRPVAHVITTGIPRARPEVAAIRAAHWAVSDRQAALVLAMPVQQGLVTGPRLLAMRRQVKGRSRRALVTTLIGDIADGAQSLGELDFGALCRDMGIPAPTRQALRRLPGGAAYLDSYWPEARLGVEIDGSGHRAGLAVSQDNLRQNEVALGSDDLILRIDLLGMRVRQAEFLDQVRRAYLARTPRDWRYPQTSTG